MNPRGIHALARAAPGRPALVEGDRTTSYRELDAAANAVANVLARAGVGQGDRVAVQLTNRWELFAVWNGIARVGALVVPVSYRAAPPEVSYLVEDSGARILVDGTDLGDVLDGPDRPANREFLGTPVMWMTYTSGTTGRPKGIVRPTPQPADEPPPQPMMRFWGFGRDDVHLLTGPAYHTAPGAYAQMHLVEGATVVVMDRFDARRCLALIDEHGVTNSHMVPANFVRILELGDGERRVHDLSSVRRILHGAAPCPEAVKRAIMEVFPPRTVWEYYGASEGMGTVISPDEWLAHPGSVGRPFPGLEIRVLDDDGRPLPPGEVGAVYVSPVPGYRFAYHDAPEETAAAWRDDVFTVGDLGWLDGDGYLYLADRRTDLIIRGGVNIYPAVVEAAAVEHPEVVDVAVIGLPDTRLGRRVHAVVERSRGSSLQAEHLRAFLATRLAGHEVPSTIEFVDVLPREPNGKVLKRRLLEERTALDG